MDEKKKEQSLFSHIDSQKLTLLKKCYPPNTILFKEGEISEDLYVLIKGSVAVMKGDKKIDIIKNQGNIFGEISALLNKPRSATVITEEYCEIVKLSGEMLLKIMNAFPDLSIGLTKILAQRLVWTTEVKAEGIED